MLITYPYRNNLSNYAAGFVNTEIRESPETLAAGPAEPGRTTSRCATTHSTAGAAGVEGAGGSGGPGRASRSTTPSRRLACGDHAGGRARRRPEHQRRHNQPSQRLACGDLAGGLSSTGTHSGQAQQDRPRGSRKSVGTTSNIRKRRAATLGTNMQVPTRRRAGRCRHNEAARPHRGRAAHALGR